MMHSRGHICTYVVPVPLTRLEGGALESEGALPGARLARGLVLGKRELACVVVPRTEEMYGLDRGRGADREAELNSGHCDSWMFDD